MRYFLVISLVFHLFACNNKADKVNTGITDSLPGKTQQDVMQADVANHKINIEDTLMQLSFVKESNRYIDSLSEHRHGIAFISDTTGDWIKVRAGYNGPERFETYYDFSIDPKTFEIKILDPVSGEYISIEEYVKSNGK